MCGAMGSKIEIPQKESKELEEEMEEEQRIFYVAVTRAKENLYLMYPQYNIFTREKNTLSRFLSENNIFKDCCDIKRIY